MIGTPEEVPYIPQSRFARGDLRAMPWSSEIYPQPKKPRICRVCKGYIKTGTIRKTLCSKECTTIYYRAGCWASLKWAVFKRDGGCCQLCDLDIKKAQRDHYAERPDRDDYKTDKKYKRALDRWSAHGRFMAGGSGNYNWWQCDHIKPVCEHVVGENPHVMPNLRTLCVPCHKKVTKALAKRRRVARLASSSGRASGMTLARSAGKRAGSCR